VDLDERLSGGLRVGDLCVIAGRPSSGKTALVLGIGDSIANRGHVVLFFSLEMGRERIAARLLSMRARISASRVERLDVSEDEMARLAHVMSHDDTKFSIETESRTVAEIEAWCERTRSRFGALDVVIVDYLQLLSPAVQQSNYETEVASISRGLKSLAKRMPCRAIVLSQLSRSPETRRDKRPQLTDLRGSGAIEQDCDVAILLYRAEMHKRGDAAAEDDGVAEAIVAKHRDGATGVVRLAFVKDVARFYDLAHENVI
jgi:replicative DNA helicase